MRKLVSFLILFIVPINIFAANEGKIAGTITDVETGDPLVGVNVVVEGTDLGAATNVNGKYFILQVPAGTYTLRAQIIGYKTVTVRNLRVLSGLTVTQDFSMEREVIEGEVVVVQAERPMIQKDLTSSRNIMTSDQISEVPFDDIQDIVGLTAGFVDGHARGGRDGEVLYMVDGVSIRDPMTGGFDTEIPEFAIEEVSVITSGYSAEFSNAQSAIVNNVLKEGNPQRYSGKIRYKTSDFGGEGHEYDEENGYYKPLGSNLSDMHRLKNLELSFGGPLPLMGGGATFHLAGEWFQDEGRYPNNYDHNNTLSGKLAFNTFARDKFTFAGTISQGTLGDYSHLWSKDTDEDKLPKYQPIETAPGPLDGWYGNGQLDTEDKNGNGKLDSGEDLNFNGLLDSEDLNRDGILTKYNMLDRLLAFDQESYSLSGTWSHVFSDNSYLKVSMGVYDTYMNYNINENINEDANGNGILDLEWDVNGNGIVDIDEDLNGNGVWDYEDLNGNGILDTDVYGSDYDMFVDKENNDLIDQSELSGQDSLDFIDRGGNPTRLNMPWEDLPFGSEKDNNGFYIFGTGAGYYRLRWNEDHKRSYESKILYVNQVNDFHSIKLGVEGQVWDIFDHDVDLASGGNVYGQNIGDRASWGRPNQKMIKPYQYGVFAEDKMEFEEFIVNLGFRYDFFDPNWDYLPEDPTDPVTDPTTGGEIKKPVSVEAKHYFSPRFGIAFPITERDRFYFNYGKMFQLPIFTYLYNNVNYDFSGAFPVVGNPDIEPENTIYYEVGVDHQFTRDILLKVVGFYKDIKGLTDTKQYFYSSSSYYTMRYNVDYGKIQGLELTLDKRFSRYVGGYINYTYSIAVGKSSSARQNYDLTWAGQIVPKEENYLDWDQRHTVNASLQFRIPRGMAPMNIRFLEEWNANLIFQYGSGLPYSPPARSLEPPINTKRMTMTYETDLSITKKFDVGPNMQFAVFAWINNLTDRRNVTGIADVEWYQVNGDTNKDGEVNSKDDYDEVLRAARGRYNDPRYNSEGRRIRLGMAFYF